MIYRLFQFLTYSTYTLNRKGKETNSVTLKKFYFQVTEFHLNPRHSSGSKNEHLVWQNNKM